MIFAYVYRTKGFVPGEIICAGCIVANSSKEAESVTRSDNKNIKGIDGAYFECSKIDPQSNGHHVLLSVPQQ